MVSRLIDLWLAEDIGACDLTCQVMIDADARGTFHMNAREPMTVAGIQVAASVFRHYDATLDVEVAVSDGERPCFARDVERPASMSRTRAHAGPSISPLPS